MSERLPQHGRFKAAVLDDDELASRYSDEDSPEERVKFGYGGYNPEVAKLTDIADILLSLRATLIAVNSEKGKMPKITPFPRPETAFDRRARERLKSKRNELFKMLTPEGG